jgi:ATP-dependent DNA helicase RecQ
VHCRRQALLGYFGDRLEQPCGNCDTCLEPVKTWDGTLAAQKALSCIHRTQQRYGVGYLIDVLRGKVTERITKAAHDKLSTFGIGVDIDEQQWHSVFRQLVARGLVAVNFDSFGALQLTESCRPILRGEQQLMLRKDLKVEKVKASAERGRSGSKKASRGFAKADDTLLWNALRAKRKMLADAQDVPPFVIFHDATLMAMLEAKPTNRSQMGLLSGIGVRKLELYADEFLAVISEFVDLSNGPIGLSDTMAESVALFRLGYSIKHIAQQRELQETTIYGHLAQSLEQGMLVLADVVELPEQEIRQIEESIINLPEDQRNALKPIYELFQGQYSYGVLRCVRAALQHQTV